MKKIYYDKNYHSGFWEELNQDVRNYFNQNHISSFANRGLWIKMIFLLLLFFSGYLSLFIFKMPLWGMWFISLLMGFAMCAIGFNISHQAAHNSLSKKAKINRLMALSLNLMGMSDYIWMLKHNISHHSYTNIYEVDEALKEGETLRLSSDAPWLPIHRFQHLYTPFVYGLFTLFWATTLDFDKLRRYNGWGSTKPTPHPIFEVVLFWFTKVFFMVVYIIIPTLLLPASFWQVMVGFLTFHIVGSTFITHILQVEHLNENTKIVKLADNGSVPVSWAVNQLEGTSNFKIKSALFQWFIGPVNYQIEHHLFPQIAGNHLPIIAKMVEAKAKKYGLSYHCYPSFKAAVISHYKFLKKLGQKPINEEGMNQVSHAI